ncbi:SRPBCC family protein [Sabulicella glaciei]|uniref:Polyketide cyclase n=1 Tax=Sabulicella glaciei TaxID=2984948 RepID=A0ABT3NWZ1_9PROT|nr:polyketide cyclase [Roseococcus sp. MDT2-1-1]MCW8086696.1 polyketide cyclase [Roseococcus sp. MDT2-1-1]
MLDARTVSVSVNRPWRELYEAIWRPECFPRWASGLSRSTLQPEGDAWTAQGPEGPVRIHFTGHNAFGVMDHFVDTGDGSVIHVPMRVVPNGAGAEVMLTLFRQPGMTDEQFEADFAWMRRDLQALRDWAGG